jgi:hypothetical protein
MDKVARVPMGGTGRTRFRRKRRQFRIDGNEFVRKIGEGSRRRLPFGGELCRLNVQPREKDMPEYLPRGVYVEGVSSVAKAIAGVSTNTACLIGLVPDTIHIPYKDPDYDATHKEAAPPFLTRVFPGTAPLPDILPAGSDEAKASSDYQAHTQTLSDSHVDPKNPLDIAHMARAGEPVLCTSFNEFQKAFGEFSTDGLPDTTTGSSFIPGGDLASLPPNTGLQNQLAHAVFGFFDNGGTRCYVMRFSNLISLRDPRSLKPLEAISEISLIAAPGIVDEAVQENIVTHCANTMNRFAILDGPVLDDTANPDKATIQRNLRDSDYAALYFPWIYVFDSATQTMHPDADGEILCAPSGHIAGIYSRVDHERGVHKAPANEVIRGAVDLDRHVSRSMQDGLNPYGINCIRRINDKITVWGARTLGGNGNTDIKYINVRRTLIFLRESIDRGTEWVVFEPNDRTLWVKITRNVTAFLTAVWQDGALFGCTPAEAFYVRRDDETNPQEERDLGKITIEIGVAIVRPAEFIVFRISHRTGPTK